MELIHTCERCGAHNRIAVSRLNQAAICGACKAKLGPLSEPIEVDPPLFESIIQGSPLPVMVDFWAAWCGPCRMAAPEVARTAAEMAGRALVLKVDTERYPELAARFQVRGIPNFAVFQGGKLQHQQAGFVTHDTMKQWLARAA